MDKQYHVEQLGLLQAQDQASDSEVTVAVIDGGVDLKHKDLKNNIVGAINILDPMKKPVADAHGTHVAGIIAAEKNNGIGGIGVNPSANLLAIDVFNGTPFTSDYHIAEGIIYAVDNGANVINMSLGGGFPSDILDSAIQYAVESGVVVVAAAGNTGSNQKEYPASYDSVISVGATNADEELANFSTYGPSVDVVAPGQDIYSTGYWNKSTYMNMSGTSMASPVVAGVVSLLLADNPDLTPSEIEYILKNTSKDLGESGYDLKYAHGLVDPGEALSFEGDIPVSYELYPEEGLEVAESLTLKDDQGSANGLLTLEESQRFYTVDVKEGEYVQTLLQGDKNVDYKLGIYFFDQDGEWMDMLELDDAREGSKEGYLYQAMTDGTILLEVKDSNKNLGVNGKASFTLDVMVTEELLDEGNSESTPTLVEELPYVLEEPAYLAGEDGDSDFYTFSVSEEQTVKVELDGVPGIDPAIKLWITEDGTEEKFEMLWEDLGYSGEGETLIFDAIPGYTYTAELMSAPYLSEDEEIFEDEFFEIDFGFYGGMSSLLPYTVTIDGKVIPEDADGFPEEYMEEEELLLSGNLSLKEYAKKSISKHDEEDEYMDEEEYEEELYNPFSGAHPITLGDDVTDYLQFGGDVDIFSFTATDNVSAKLAVTSKGKINPLVELYAFDEQFGEWAVVQMNIGLYSMSDQIMANLVEGTDYVVAVSDLDWTPSFDSYTVSTEIMGSYEQDEFEPNNLDVHAYDLGEETVSGNLTASGDMDLFYLPPGESGVWGFHTSVTPDPSSKLPLDPVVIVLADINGDKVLDWEEFESQQMYDTGFENESESGSFMRKEEAGQFIVVLNYFGGANVNSTSTYELTTSPIATEDEDENSVVKGNVPSHPLALKKQGQTWSAKGYFNSKSLSDDMDWYVLPTWENTRATLSLKAPGTDATMKVYDSKGQQIASVDDYGKDDHEVRAFTLGKGPYYVSVTTYDGNGSLLPYELNVTSNVTPKNGKERISGNTRYETSLAFAKKIADHSLDTVILASGENYPDALAGGPLAESLNGTVILVNEKLPCWRRHLKKRRDF
ncbi:S8 family serine peptidase [Bacillus coahuilensis]|uniref:S8 family serine peptidase n=1 Tax=Bacillus coahuilensis TaxID=408580 RepID=UPI00018513CA|nr:S8 family serine peptidase [Bacillus coahuilensis]